jgi:hypothetical protein
MSLGSSGQRLASQGAVVIPVPGFDFSAGSSPTQHHLSRHLEGVLDLVAQLPLEPGQDFLSLPERRPRGQVDSGLDELPAPASPPEKKLLPVGPRQQRHGLAGGGVVDRVNRSLKAADFHAGSFDLLVGDHESTSTSK